MSQADAEEFCRCNGMHLVSWESRAEQNEVRRPGPAGNAAMLEVLALLPAAAAATAASAMIFCCLRYLPNRLAAR